MSEYIPLELESQSIDSDYIKDNQRLIKISHFEKSNIIYQEVTIENFNFFIITLTTFETNQSNDSLPLVHPDLIDWEQNESIEIDYFRNDYVIAQYLNVI